MRISNLSNSDDFNERDVNISLRIIRYEALILVVESFIWFTRSLKRLTLINFWIESLLPPYYSHHAKFSPNSFYWFDWHSGWVYAWKAICISQTTCHVSGEFVPLDCFSQTSWRLVLAPVEYFCNTTCLPATGKSTRFIPFLRQAGTIRRELVAVEKPFTDDLCRSFNFWFIQIQSVFKMREDDWHHLIWLVVPFMASLSIQGLPYTVLLFWATVATKRWPIGLLHCYSQVATMFLFISD